MTADLPEIKHTLLSKPSEQQLSALKRLKNATIGYQEIKEHVAKDEELLEIILKQLESGPYDAQLQSAYVLGSLAHGNTETQKHLIDHQVLPLLIKTLRKTTSQELSTACFRAFVTLLKSRPNISLQSCNPDLFVILKNLVSDDNTSLSVLNHCSQIIEGLAGSPGSTAYLTGLTNTLIAKIASLLLLTAENKSPIYLQTVSSSLSALSRIITSKEGTALLSANYELGVNGKIITGTQLLDALTNCTKLNSNEVRIHASELLVKLQKYCVDYENNNSNDSYYKELHDKLVLPILPTLIPIFNQTPDDPRIMKIVGTVCVDNKNCARIAVETGLISKTVGLLKSRIYSNTTENNELAEGYLLALAAIALQTDEYRMNEVSCGILPILLSIISSKDPEDAGNNRAATSDDSDKPLEIVNSTKVKVAACHVLQALSRSIKLLRTSLGTLDVIDGLKALLIGESNTGSNVSLQRNETQCNKSDMDVDVDNDSSIDDSEEQHQHQRRGGEGVNNNDVNADVDYEKSLEDQLEAQTAVMATICNLIIEFSPLHKDILEKGILDIIIEYCHSPYPPLRLNSIWALKNVVYEAVRPVKDMVLQKLTWPYLVQLTEDSEPEIQEQALEFTRNILCRNSPMTNKILNEYPDGPLNIFHVIEKKLNTKSEEKNPGIVVATIYILVHIAAGDEPHRTIITENNDILNQLLRYLSSSHVGICTACVWLLINLTYIDDTGNFPLHGPFKERAQKLVMMGFKDKLQELATDGTLDVCERAKTALAQLHNLIR